MASRIAEVVYKLKDLFSGPAKGVERSYDRIKASSRDASRQVEADNSRIGKSFGALGALIRRSLGPLIAFYTVLRTGRAVATAADDLDRLGKAADKLDIDVEQLAALEFAADRSGAAIASVEKGLFTLQKRTGEAVRGIGAARLAFEELGIDAAEFAELDAAQQIELLAEQFETLAGEETRAAVAAALFSKEGGAELLKILNQGGDALRDYVEQFKALRDVSDETTAKAAEFNDALTNLRTFGRGLLDRVINPLISGFVSLSRAVGLTEASLEERLTDAQERLARLEALRGRAARAQAENLADARREVAKLTAEVEKNAAAEAEKTRIAEEAAKAREEQARAEEEYKEQLKDTTRLIEEQASFRQRKLNEETAQLRAARTEQQRIEEEFADLRDEVTAPAAEDVTGLDVQVKALEARRQLAAGDAEAAIETARQGADLLQDLKSQGDEAGFVLGFLADQLGKVAREAAEQRSQAEVVDVARAAEQFNVITAKIAQLKTTAAREGTEIGRAIVAGINAELRVADYDDAIQEGLRTWRRQLEQEAPK